MQTYGTPAFLQPELPILSNSEMPFRSILRAARISRSLTAPHAGHTHVRSRNDRPLLMQPHSQVLEEGYHCQSYVLSLHTLKQHTLVYQ